MKKLLLILLCLPIIGLGQSHKSVLSAELDAFIQTQVISNNIIGLSACIIKDNQVIWKAAYGTVEKK